MYIDNLYPREYTVLLGAQKAKEKFLNNPDFKWVKGFVGFKRCNGLGIEPIEVQSCPVNFVYKGWSVCIDWIGPNFLMHNGYIHIAPLVKLKGKLYQGNSHNWSSIDKESHILALHANECVDLITGSDVYSKFDSDKIAKGFIQEIRNTIKRLENREIPEVSIIESGYYNTPLELEEAQQ